jgi:hypothetical protein
MMIRQVLSGAVLFALLAGLAAADEFPAYIRKIEDGEVIFEKAKWLGEKQSTHGKQFTLPTSKNVKVLVGKPNRQTKKLDPGEPLQDGLKNEKILEAFEEFKKVPWDALYSNIITNQAGDTIEEIRIRFVPKPRRR